jgi:hypothetical protein
MDSWNGGRPDTTVTVSREQHAELRQIALDLTRAERRRFTISDVIGRLLAAWRREGSGT